MKLWELVGLGSGNYEEIWEVIWMRIWMHEFLSLSHPSFIDAVTACLVLNADCIQGHYRIAPFHLLAGSHNCDMPVCIDR